MGEPGVVAVLDIGGTKIAGALVTANGRLFVKIQRPTPARADAAVLIAAVGAVLTDLATSAHWPRVEASASPVPVRSTSPREL